MQKKEWVIVGVLVLLVTVGMMVETRISTRKMPKEMSEIVFEAGDYFQCFIDTGSLFKDNLEKGMSIEGAVSRCEAVYTSSRDGLVSCWGEIDTFMTDDPFWLKQKALALSALDGGIKSIEKGLNALPYYKSGDYEKGKTIAGQAFSLFMVASGKLNGLLSNIGR